MVFDINPLIPLGTFLLCTVWIVFVVLYEHQSVSKGKTRNTQKSGRG